MNDTEKTKQFLSEQQFIVLAVTLDDGTPWATPVKIQKQDGNVFEWDSHIETEHSKALIACPDMAITVFQKQEDSQIGFYAKGTGECVETKEHGIGRYRFTVKEAWLNDETFVKRAVTL